MMLPEKNALVFAATGAIGSAVARTFAKEGARVWLSARNGGALEKLADAITTNGGTATADVVDATDPDAVTAYVDQVARRAGRIDVVFNAIGPPPYELGYPARSTTQNLDLLDRPHGRRAHGRAG